MKTVTNHFKIALAATLVMGLMTGCFFEAPSLQRLVADPVMDATVPDAETILDADAPDAIDDVGFPADATEPDAGFNSDAETQPDAAVQPDANEPDASMVDSGSVDSGTMDAGMMGGTADAGFADSGPPDSGVPPTPTCNAALYSTHTRTGTAGTYIFCLQKLETTLRRYNDCVAGGACTPAGGMQAVLDLPVVMISYAQAEAFAQWLGGRLPTEAEWLFVATANGTQPWPWGNDAVDCTRANIPNRNGVPGCGTNVMAVPGTYPDGDTDQDDSDMIGNVWEMTSTMCGTGRRRDLGGAYDNEVRNTILNSCVQEGSLDLTRGFRIVTSPR